MSHIFGGGDPKVIPEFTGLQVNTAVQVLPVPIIYGAPRVSINLIYYNGFNSKLVSTGGGGASGGKGLLSGGKGGGSQQVEYFATIIMAIGEGPLGAPMIIYQDQNVWEPSNYPTNGAFYFNGSPTQTPWAYVTSRWPNDSRGYKQTAYYGFSNAQLDSSATVPQIDLVIQGFASGSSPLNNSTIAITTGQYDPHGNPVSFIGNIHIGCADADPASVIYDFLTNPTYGATFPAEWIDTSTLFTTTHGYNALLGDNTLSSYCQAVGLAWSVVINNVETASSILERWCKNLNVAPVWDGQMLKFLPYWDQFASGNPGWDPSVGVPMKYYAPNVTSLITLTMDHIIQSDNKEDDPITFTRKDPMEVYNTVRVDFRDRYNFWNDVPAEAKDEAHIELYGPRIDNIGLANEFSLNNYAATSATMQLRRNIGIMRTFTWKMGPLWTWLSPMNVITIPDPTNYSNSIIVRITSVEDDEDENVTINAEEFPLGAASPTILPMTATTPPNQGSINSPAAPAYPPVIFEPTTLMLTAIGYATPVFVLGDSGGYDGTLDVNWGGVRVWLSVDNVNYELIGALFGPSIMGFITSPLPAFGGANPDLADTLYVTLNESDGNLESTSATAAAAGHSACIVQDINGYEVLTYTTATLESPFTYTLTGLYRGLYGTTPRAFASGARFLFVGTNANVLIENLPAAYIGVNFWVKPQSFNVFNNVAEDLSDVTAYEYLVVGSESGNAFILVDGVTASDQLALAWQRFTTLSDSVVTSEILGVTLGAAATLSDSVAAADAVTPPASHVTLGDSVAVADRFLP